jgi:transposase-like protein
MASRLSEVLWEEYEAFQRRDLSGFEMEYLFLDAIYETLRSRWGVKEAVLVAWGITRDGRKVLLGMALGSKEGFRDWLEFLRDLVKRGLRLSTTITSDRPPGLIKAVEAVFGQSLRIRCWVHKMRNLSSKVLLRCGWSLRVSF